MCVSLEHAHAYITVNIAILCGSCSYSTSFHKEHDGRVLTSTYGGGLLIMSHARIRKVCNVIFVILAILGNLLLM